MTALLGDARIRVVPGPGAGMAAALTTGLAACRAPYVARMDADDVMRRDRLARQLAALDADPTLAAVGARVRIFPRAGLRDGWRAYERWLNAIDTPARVRAEAFVENPIVHPTLCARREVLCAFFLLLHAAPLPTHAGGTTRGPRRLANLVAPVGGLLRAVAAVERDRPDVV